MTSSQVMLALPAGRAARYREPGRWVSCGAWSRTVRQALVWAGEADPCGVMDRIRGDNQDLATVFTGLLRRQAPVLARLERAGTGLNSFSSRAGATGAIYDRCPAAGKGKATAGCGTGTDYLGSFPSGATEHPIITNPPFFFPGPSRF